jgi:large subunit ribosomal protein L18
MKTQEQRYEFRKLRSRKKIFGTPEKPRLSVYRSLKHIYAQVIDDVSQRTIVAASTKDKGVKYTSGIPGATLVGETLGKKAMQKGIKMVVFDRGARPYHGRIKAVAESARKAGLQF